MTEAGNNTYGPDSVAAHQFKDLKAACGASTDPAGCGQQVAVLEKAYLDNPKDYSDGVLTVIDPNCKIICVPSVAACVRIV